jgi:CRISPR-associated protein Csd1
MILRALLELARTEGLSESLDYQPLAVRWILTIGPGGEVLGGFTDTMQPPANGKGRPAAKRMEVPKRSSRTTQNLAEFVIDKPEYVFGWFDENEIKADSAEKRAATIQKRRQRSQERHTIYRAEVRAAAEQTGDEGLRALVQFLDRPVPALPTDLGEGDLIGFQYSNDEEVRLITDRPKVRAYWARRRRQTECGTGLVGAEPSLTSGEGVMPCLVLGELRPPVELHPKIKGIPPLSDTKGGVQLTSVNQPAFESYDLEEIGCAPVSREAADAYEKALNRLLSDPRRKVSLTHNAVVVFWSKGDAALVDLFSDAIAVGNPDSIRALYESTWKGSPIQLDDVSPFYSLTLSGAIGRGTVRGWHETTLGAVLRSLRQYFHDLEIVRRQDEEGRPRPLLALLRQLAVQGDLENIAPNLAGEVFAAILAGRPFPRSVLDSAVRRTRAERTIYGDRAALLKAFLCRARRAGQFDNSLPEVRPMLDEACVDPAYRLGRLFAVLEKIQEDAIGANSTIRDRYYGAASATPIVVFPQLMRKLPHHLAKLTAATYFEKIIQQICDGLQPPTPFPPALKLEEQGLFAIGYYHQRQALFTKRDKAAPQTTETQST